MNIRKLNENDYDQYKIIINEFRETEFTKEDFIYILNNIKIYSDIWLLEINNEIASIVTILYEYKFIHNICKLAHIEDVCTLKKYRGNGYSKLLLNYIINEAKNNGCYKITLYCNEDLEDFYKKNNFEKKGIQMAIYY
jgi:glucosamine-phosphate N-acetyltransferase